MNEQEIKKEEKVYNVFQKISEGYDDANTRISMGKEKKWKQNLINLFDEFEYNIDDEDEKSNTVNILDVCTGTGDIALALKKAHPGFTVHGLDFSPAMLDVARQKSRKDFPESIIPPVIWHDGDAMKLPMPDNSFDGACISFGLRNTPNYKQVLLEMKRVVKPGGIVACLDSFVPENKFIRFFYNIYFKHIMPLIGGHISNKEEYDWLAQSTEAFLSPTELEHLFVKIGLNSVHQKSFMLGACCMHWGRK